MNLPTEGYLRLKQNIGNPKAIPPIPPIIPVSKSHWWAGVKSGFYPQPVKVCVSLPGEWKIFAP